MNIGVTWDWFAAKPRQWPNGYMEHLTRRARVWGNAVLNLLLPPSCLTCDAEVDGFGRFCAACFAQAQFISQPFCRRCAAPFSHAAQFVNGVCPHCAQAPPPWEQARAALRYDVHSRRMILLLKHNDRPELARALAPMMVRAGAALLEAADLLVPVPLHPARLRARRYNQAALLAREIGRLTQVPTRLDALVRLRATQSLGDLSADQRAAMVAGAFAPRRGAVAWLMGRRIVLVDDVLTSGATGGACTLALLAAGATRVDVLVAARVPDPRLELERHLAVRRDRADL